MHPRGGGGMGMGGAMMRTRMPTGGAAMCELLGTSRMLAGRMAAGSDSNAIVRGGLEAGALLGEIGGLTRRAADVRRVPEDLPHFLSRALGRHRHRAGPRVALRLAGQLIPRFAQAFGETALPALLCVPCVLEVRGLGLGWQEPP